MPPSALLDESPPLHRLQKPATLSTRLHFLRTGTLPVESPPPLAFTLDIEHAHHTYVPGESEPGIEINNTRSYWTVPSTPMTQAALLAWSDLLPLRLPYGQSTPETYLHEVFKPFWELISEGDLTALSEASETSHHLKVDLHSSEFLTTVPTHSEPEVENETEPNVDDLEPAFDPSRPYGLQQSGASPCALDLDAEVTTFEGWNLAITDAADRNAQTLLPPYLPNLKRVLEEGWGLAVLALQFDEREPQSQGWPQTVLTCHLPGCSHSLLEVGMSTAQALFRHPKFNAEERKPMLHWVTREVLVVINSDHTFYPHLITLVPEAPAPDPAHLN